ncbi:MAG: NAD-dependent dehydratase [Leptospiraceae bacterium]|nr:NAD-dependent dehydratase [Leptospiraceae bacterium]
MSHTVLVTGGAGFIGSHLCERLLEQGDYVICLDNFFTGRRRNIAHLLNNRNFELIRHDITEPIRIEVDRIYNMACPASPVHYQANPVKTMKTSVLGTMNLLGLAKRTGARLLQASTSEVYGDPEVHPQPESYRGSVNPIGIRACYDEGKRAAETLCFDYHRMHGVDIRVIRIFNTYGPRMDPADGRVVSNFIVQALKGEDITIYGDGTQTRSFCYVDDLVNGILKFMKHEGHTGPVNLGNDGEFTVQELAQEVIRLTGSQSRVVNQPLPQDDPTRRRPDLTLARQLFDYELTAPLAEGLRRTIEYFRHL